MNVDFTKYPLPPPFRWGWLMGEPAICATLDEAMSILATKAWMGLISTGKEK